MGQEKSTDRVTSLEVARRAGVSQSAVSRVFTPGASASQKTIDKVRRAASELGYRPNVLARSLITGRSRIIGVVVGYLENLFYPEALENLSNALQAEGYHVLVFMASNSSDNIETVVQEILDYQVDGIVLASVGLSSDLAGRCTDAGIPVVLFNRSQDDARLSAVTSDNVEGGRKLAEFLVAGGHSRIAYIAGWEEASTQRDREAGFRAGLEAAGQTLWARDCGEFSYPAAQAAARRMFAGADRPDAVFVGNDHMAFAVMDTLRFELGLSVPDDVSVVGYDDVMASAWPSFDLTTVRQPARRMVSETVRMLLGRIDGAASAPERTTIDGPLIVRGSARKPEGWTP
ncbi:LacI family DNA-binding transcriptional regulator [Oceanomicrobium pacificus]|uniref:Substrate-binding domain-containing protein n=1 Tax=Oceanomicrobium pacificus TaxID=2692916 RepID=A0A6B0TK21_9RHOB|nr:LacI family DNA-binding transcriptional regulator [Oceanomicrobium pacificus]MXU64797.1 substrate-binding domain-containing protein [Oceanomicrobium pacificus]